MAPAEQKLPASLLALDFGLRRIGIATASPLAGTASPLTTIQAQDGIADWQQLDTIVSEWQPELIVVGLPTNTDGSESEMTALARDFAGEIDSRYEAAVIMWDERYTSREAEAILKQQRQSGARNKRIKKEDVDSMAAMLIAESWIRAEQKQS